MKLESTSHWFQILASFGVLAGLVLVAYELNRNEKINVAALANSGMETLQNSHLSYVGENPAPVLSKACLDPDSLTTEDFFVLHSLYRFRTSSLARVAVVSYTGQFDFTEYQEILARSQTRAIASTKPGRAWLKVNTRLLPEMMKPYASAEIQSPTLDCASMMEAFISQTREERDQG